MKYLLVIGFSCKVYKKQPQARIFIHNKLIDEFHISPHTDTFLHTHKDHFKNNHILQPFFNIKHFNMEIKSFPPLRFYEVDIDTILDQVELRIEIENNDSNYVNGFMSKSTLIKLQVCYIFPLNEKLLLRLVEIRKKTYLNKNYAWYHCNKNTIFRLTDNGIKWCGKNKETLTTDKYLKTYDIGGSGYFTCDLVKKYGIYISKLSRSYRYNLFQTPTIDYFLNKYKQHANQRNSD